MFDAFKILAISTVLYLKPVSGSNLSLSDIFFALSIKMIVKRDDDRKIRK